MRIKKMSTKDKIYFLGVEIISPKEYHNKYCIWITVGKICTCIDTGAQFRVNFTMHS